MKTDRAHIFPSPNLVPWSLRRSLLKWFSSLHLCWLLFSQAEPQRSDPLYSYLIRHYQELKYYKNDLQQIFKFFLISPNAQYHYHCLSWNIPPCASSSIGSFSDNIFLAPVFIFTLHFSNSVFLALYLNDFFFCICRKDDLCLLMTSCLAWLLQQLVPLFKCTFSVIQPLCPYCIHLPQFTHGFVHCRRQNDDFPGILTSYFRTQYWCELQKILQYDWYY